MTTIFATLGKTLGNNKDSVQNFGIVGITIASEELSKFIFFYCPCDFPRNQFYGTCFIWGPAVVLLVVGYLANRRTWRLTTGLCNRSQAFLGKGRRKRLIHFLFIFCSIGVKAMIAPATWVVLAFLQGDYYACAHWPNPSRTYTSLGPYFQLKWKNDTLPKPCLFNPNPAEFNPDSDAEIIARTLRAESHVIGWLYLTIGMLVAVVVMFTFRCYSNFSYEQTNYIDRYRKHEIDLFEQKLDEKSKELAQLIVDGYFANARSKEEWDKIAVINDKVTRSKRGKAIYSPLHRFVNKTMSKVDDNDSDELKSIKKHLSELNLVQDAAMKKKNNLARKPKNKLDNKSDTARFSATSQKTVRTSRPSQPAVQDGKRSCEAIGGYMSSSLTETSLDVIDETRKEPTPHASESNKILEVPETKPIEDPQGATTSAGVKLDEGEYPHLELADLHEETNLLTPETHFAIHNTQSKPSGRIQEISMADSGGYYLREDLSKNLGVDGSEVNEENDESDFESEALEKKKYEKLESSDELPLLDNNQ